MSPIGKTRLLMGFCWFALALSPIADARGGGGYKRSAQAKSAFRLEHPCPATGKASGRCPGYVIDHVVPLCAGGADKPQNMAWQESGAAKIKDGWERSQCRSLRTM